MTAGGPAYLPWTPVIRTMGRRSQPDADASQRFWGVGRAGGRISPPGAEHPAERTAKEESRSREERTLLKAGSSTVAPGDLGRDPPRAAGPNEDT